MFEIVKALLFGIIEGISEWLPISSTGHMILFGEIIKFKDVSAGFWDMFLIVIQLGAILAVVLIFWKKIFPFDLTKTENGFAEKNFIKKDIFSMWFKIIFACIPAAVIELTLGDKINELFYNYQTVAVMLIVVGIAFILIENYNKRRKSKINSLSDITYSIAFYIGMFQVIAAVFPGTSRSGATIIGALLLGVSRTVAAEFTFFLAIPVMFGASFMELLDFGFDFKRSEVYILLVGMGSAFLISVFVIKFLMGYIKRHDFKVFGWYRIILGIIVLIAGLFSAI